MLQTLREKPLVKKVVLSAVLVVMVLGLGVGVTAVFSDLLGTRTGSSVASGPWLMRIGSETITPMAYEREVVRVRRQFEQMGLTTMPEAQLREQAKATLMRHALEIQEARKAGIKVTDQEVSDYITSMPDLQRDGRFIGSEAYQHLLQQNSLDVGAFESGIRESLLIQKWESLVGAGAIVTDREVDDEYAHRSQKVRFDYVLLDPLKFAPALIADPEVKAWFDSHQDRYQRGEARRAKYVLIDSKGSEAQIPPPTDEEIRKAYEADKARYPATFEAAKEAVKHQLIFQKAQAETDRRAATFRATITDPSTFDASAQKQGLKVEDTGLVRREGETTDLGPAFVDALFKAQPGTVTGPVQTLRGSAVLVVTETKPAGLATIEEARKDILEDLRKDKGRAGALDAAKKAVASANGDLAAVAQKVGGTVQNGPLVSKGEPVPSLGYEAAVEGAAFATDPGHIAEPVATSSGSIVVLKVAEKKTPEAAAESAGSREQIRSELRRNKEQALLNSVLETAFNRTEHQINEELFKQLGS